VFNAGVSGILTAPVLGHGYFGNVYNVFLQMGAQFGVFSMISLLLIWIKLLVTYPKEVENSESEIIRIAFYWACFSLFICSLAESSMGNQLGYHSWFFLFILGLFQQKNNITVQQ